MCLTCSVVRRRPCILTILESLDRYYDRISQRQEAEQFGFTREKISFAITLSDGGEAVAVADLRLPRGKRLVPRLISVPAAVRRTVAIVPNFLWDKSAYVLGCTASPGKRTSAEHAAFRSMHLDLLAGSSDPALTALRRFIECWRPEDFGAAPFFSDMLDTNIVFRIDGEQRYVHEGDAARDMIARRLSPEGSVGTCLVRGVRAPIARLHPVIKGITGAQPSGANLVSFNLEASTSYRREQGENAPVSEVAAFRYGTALHHLLEQVGRNRLKHEIADTTVIFWADSADVGEAGAKAAEEWFAAVMEPSEAESGASEFCNWLDSISATQSSIASDPQLYSRTQFHILGLSPNVARLSVRYWITGPFGDIVRQLKTHHHDLSIEPRPWHRSPSVSQLLLKAAARQEKRENIPPILAGEMMRAVLTGARYPRMLLSVVMSCLRAGADPGTGWHAAAIRALLVRSRRSGDIPLSNEVDLREEGLPMSLDRNNPNPAYQLGRLFATMELVQRMATGHVNATIRDRYFGLAAATPGRIFPLLMRTTQNTFRKLGKSRRSNWLQREISEIVGGLPPELPRSLSLEAQGRFVIGYYHQRRGRSSPYSLPAGSPYPGSELGANDE